MSITVSGRITSSFIRSSNVVPPARYCALLRCAPNARTAAAALSTRSKTKGRIALLPRCLPRLLDGVDDVRIGGATAQIAAHVFANVGVLLRMSLMHAGDRRQDLSRCAVATLEGVVIDEGLLHRMQMAVLRKTLDGRHGLILHRCRERQARKHASPLDQYRT